MKELMLYHTISLGLGIILDQIIGDPHFMPHPIRLVGNLIAFLEKRLLGSEAMISNSTNRNKKRERRRGTLLWFIVVIVVMIVTLLLIMFSYKLNRYLGIVVESILTCYILAARSLYRESMAVYKELIKSDGELGSARYALSMIVGRDTQSLDKEDIAKAAVETVAENTSDGVIAPLFYTAIGGPVLGFMYKAVNTMDSMLGYKNERYENFGFFAAKADDVFNFIPSRLSAVLMIAGSGIMGIFTKNYNGKKAWKIWRRDRLNHNSPNSAQTESVCAGALGLRLGGTHLYKGVVVEKPTIGDEERKTEPLDIKRANCLMFMTEFLMVILVGVVALILIQLCVV